MNPNESNHPFLRPDQFPHFESRRSNTLAWFTEWNAESILRSSEESPKPFELSRFPMQLEEGPDPEQTRTFSSHSFRRHTYDTDPSGFEPGCIRMPGPEVTGGEDASYFLVLGKWTPGWLLMAPFSRFESPASLWELRHPSAPGPLQVVQAWNIRTLPEALAAQSWCVGKLPQSLADDVKTLFFASATGKTRALNTLWDRLGCGIVDPKDPRLEFLEQEARRFPFLDRRLSIWENLKTAPDADEASVDIESSSESEVLDFPMPTPLAFAASTDTDSLIPSMTVSASLVETLDRLHSGEGLEAKSESFRCEVSAAIRRTGGNVPSWIGLFTPKDPPCPIPNGAPFLLLRRASEHRPLLVGSGRAVNGLFQLREGTDGLDDIPYRELALILPTADLCAEQA